MCGGKMKQINRRSALQTFGSYGIGVSSVGILSGMTRSAELESTSIKSIPTEPEYEVYSFVDEERSWPGDYEISHTMEWFQSWYSDERETWNHDFSIQSHACSRHDSYDTLIPECTGWGYRIESGAGHIKKYVNDEMHGVHPKGATGDMPEWTDVVLEGALGTLSTSASILYTAEELMNLMQPADGFDTSPDDGFRWLYTYDYFDDGAEQVSSHHRVNLEGNTSSPLIETNATVRIDHDPIGSDTWLDMEVLTNDSGPISGPNSETQSLDNVHPEDMSTEEKERLGIKRVDNVEIKGFGVDSKESDEKHHPIVEKMKENPPTYIMTKCPWTADVESNIVREDRKSVV